MFGECPTCLQWLYVAVFVVAGGICIAGIIGTRTFAHPDIRRGLGGVLGLNGVWSLITAAQLTASSPAAQRLVHLGGLIVGISTVFAWLAFASAYAGRGYHRQRSLQVASIVLLALVIGIKLTNPIHGAYFTTRQAVEPFGYLVFEYGTFHWFVTGFAYTASGVGFLWLFDSFERGDSRPRRLYGLVAVTAVPLVPYALAPQFPSLLKINYEPLGVAVFAIGTLVYARDEFATHSSPGQSTLADSLSEGGLVVDDSGIVIDSNEQAARILGEPSLPRAPLAEIDPKLSGVEPGETTQRTYEVDGRSRTYEIRRTQVDEDSLAAELVTLKDVTRATRVERLVGIHRELNEAILEGTEPGVLLRRYPKLLTEPDGYALGWLAPVGDDSLPASTLLTDGAASMFGADTDIGRLTRSTAGGETTPFGDESNNDSANTTDNIPGVVAGDATEYARWVADSDDDAAPIKRAADTGDVQYASVSETNEPWSQQAAKAGITECLAVPMTVGDTEYVVAVYSTAPDGFDSTERTLIREFSERVPRSIAAIQAHAEALRFEEAITHAGVAVSITDTDGVIQYVNPAFESLTGYDAEEAVGATHRILQSGEMSENYYEDLWETILDGNIYSAEVVDKTKAGDRYTAQQTISPVTDDDGEPQAFVSIQIDITDRLLREQRLTVLNRILRHNIRTAINVVTGTTTLLEDQLTERIDGETLPTEIEDALETIRERAARVANQAEMAREVETILGEETGDELTSIDAVVSAARETAAALGASCTVTIDDTARNRTVDAELSRITEELVENAVQHHTREPEAVDVSVDISIDGEEVILSVADDGPGLSEQELVVVEEGDETELRHGSGLGLWLVNWLAISGGGSINATSDDEGTVIRASLPLRGTVPDGDAGDRAGDN
jgi:PAS domain S-box-containing protein